MSGTISIHGDPLLDLPEIEFNFEMYTTKNGTKKLRTCTVSVPERDTKQDYTEVNFQDEDITLELLDDQSLVRISFRSNKWMVLEDKDVTAEDLNDIERFVLSSTDPITMLAFNIGALGWTILEDGVGQLSEASQFFGKAIEHWKNHAKDNDETTDSD